MRLWQTAVVRAASQVRKCKRVKLSAGDVLYMPAGQIHMAWSDQRACPLIVAPMVHAQHCSNED